MGKLALYAIEFDDVKIYFSRDRGKPTVTVISKLPGERRSEITEESAEAIVDLLTPEVEEEPEHPRICDLKLFGVYPKTNTLGQSWWDFGGMSVSIINIDGGWRCSIKVPPLATHHMGMFATAEEAIASVSEFAQQIASCSFNGIPKQKEAEL